MKRFGRYCSGVLVLLFATGIVAAEAKKDSNFAPATLYLRGIAADAEVIINDNLVKQNVSGPIITPPGYLRIMVGVRDTVYHKTFFIHPNERKIFNFQSDPRFAAIDLITDPLGADVLFDGKKAGVTPFMDSVITPGLISLTVEKSGYETIRKEVQVLPQEELELTLEMKHTPAWLDSVAREKIRRHKKAVFVQRVIWGVACVAGAGGAAFFDRTAQHHISVADAAAGSYDNAAAGFQTYKSTYATNRELAGKNIDRRNISAAITGIAALGLTITFFF